MPDSWTATISDEPNLNRDRTKPQLEPADKIGIDHPAFEPRNK